MALDASSTPSSLANVTATGATRTQRSTLQTLINKEVQESLVAYFKELTYTQSMRAEMHENLERIDREYCRQGNFRSEHLQSKALNESGDKSKIQDVTIPIIYPQVESGLAYLTGVFLSGYPIFGIVSDPQTAQIADAMESVIANQQLQTGWIRHLTLAMRDALKYNFCAVEVSWERKTSFSLSTDTTLTSGRAKRDAEKQIFWEGNQIKRLDPYNIIFDYRVHPANIHTDGEFAGYTEIFSRIKLKQFVANLPEAINLKEAFESGPVQGTTTGVGSSEAYYVPDITDKLNPNPRSGEFDWMKWAMLEKATFQYRNSYIVTTIYCRILPSDFGIRVPAQNTVQIWKFIYVNNSILIYAERMTNAHDYLPIIFCQPTEDGLGYQTLSFAENLLSSQEMATSLWNIKIASERRNVSDRVLYDVTRIRPEDINSSNPAAKIPVRPTGYTRPISDSVHQFPFNNAAAGSAVQDAMAMVDFSRSISGINRNREGQFTKGNRTLGEFQDTTKNADERLQLLAIFMEAQWFIPIKEIIKTNILQYQTASKVFSKKAKGAVDINPIQLRELAFEFKVSDGLLPSSKIVNSDYLKNLLNIFATNPVIAAEFDVVPLLAYISSLENIPNLENFRRAPAQTQGAAPNVVSTPTPSPASTQRGADPRATAGSAPNPTTPPA